MSAAPDTIADAPVEELRRRVAALVADRILPLEADPADVVEQDAAVPYDDDDLR